jgi:hypothetical protein
MIQFRNDVMNTISPYIVFSQDLDRYWVIREMEESLENIESDLKSGEYAIVTLLAIIGIFFNSPIYVVPSSYLLTILAILLSTLIFVRTVAIDILAYHPEQFQEYPTQELAVRMIFNRQVLSRGTSIGFVVVSFLVSLFRGMGYEEGLKIIEMFADLTHPDEGERWEL